MGQRAALLRHHRAVRGMSCVRAKESHLCVQACRVALLGARLRALPPRFVVIVIKQRASHGRSQRFQHGRCSKFRVMPSPDWPV